MGNLLKKAKYTLNTCINGDTETTRIYRDEEIEPLVNNKVQSIVEKEINVLSSRLETVLLCVESEQNIIKDSVIEVNNEVNNNRDNLKNTENNLKDEISKMTSRISYLENRLEALGDALNSSLSISKNNDNNI